ncbi:interferon-inducible GTPase 5-like [Aplochiton taeniatus]
MAVTGETGSGKSSFVNALRGLSDDDEGAAETGVTETTMEPTRYTHPVMPNVYLWDLPGIGTPNFQAKTYLKKVRLETYDFFIIIASERFKENHILLAKEIKKMKKLFYFVRSKIDNDVKSEKRRKNFNEEQLLTKIRGDCGKNLKDVGDPKVFLVSSYELEKYDFNKLVDALKEDLSEDMGSIFIQSLPVCSVEMIQTKKETFKKIMWLSCFSSAGVAMVPVPGLSVAADIGIMVYFLTSCYHAFGLNEKSVRLLSTKSNKTEGELREAMKSIFADGITKEVVIRFAGSAAVGAAMTLEYFLSIIPVVGTVMAGGLSFTTTYILLNKGLNEMADAALRMLNAAGLA